EVRFTMSLEDRAADLEEGGYRAAPAPRAAAPTAGRVVVLLTAGLLVLTWLVGKVVLVLLAGVLAAVGLSAFTDWLVEHGVKSRVLALFLVIAVNLALLGATGWLLAPEISQQTDELAQQLPQAWNALLQK